MTQWICHIAGCKQEPVDLPTLQSWVAGGRLAPHDLVYVEAADQWVDARDVPQLQAAFAANPPPQPASIRPKVLSKPGQWFCRIGANNFGPLDLETLQKWVRDGRLGFDDQVYSQKFGLWIAAIRINELQETFALQPPPLPDNYGQRPTALTVAAILNFVSAALLLAVFWGVVGSRTGVSDLGLVLLASCGILVLLLIVSGAGCLRQTFFGGYVLGSICGVLLILQSVAVIVIAGRFSCSLLGAPYGLVLLMALNAHKQAFEHPTN